MSLITLKRTSSTNPDFQQLVEHLDVYLSITDGDEHSFYDQFNKLDNINHVILAYEDGVAVGCGAIKKFDDQSMEIKRMYTAPIVRGQGIATQIIKELEIWAKELGNSKCILETGLRQFEAVGFYKKSGYKITPCYGQYADVENSICFEKKLI